MTVRDDKKRAEGAPGPEPIAIIGMACIFPQAGDLRAFWNNIVGDTKPVGSYPAGATEKGVMDMAGNAWEWTDSLWCDSWASGAPCNTNPVARGGSWNSTDADFVRPAWRDPDSNGDKRFGFRCVYDPSP